MRGDPTLTLGMRTEVRRFDGVLLVVKSLWTGDGEIVHCRSLEAKHFRASEESAGDDHISTTDWCVTDLIVCLELRGDKEELIPDTYVASYFLR